MRKSRCFQRFVNIVSTAIIMENRELVHDLLTLSALHRCRMGKAASSIGLYFGQPMMLGYISANPGCLQKEVASNLHISDASAATSLKRLEKAGYILREDNKKDARQKILSITEKGTAAMEEFHKICDETDTQFFSGFTEDERAELQSFLKRLQENLISDKLTDEDIDEILHHHPNQK